MTKRRIRNDKPIGFNKTLGNQLVNQGKAKRVFVQPNVARTASPTKVLDSVTHESNLDEFFNNAQLANRDFTAERNIRVIASSESTVVNPDDLSSKSYVELNELYGDMLRIPRRPKPGTYETAEELDNLENDSFLNWKRNVSLMQESHGVVMTPFERNLELWRQLWRVVERSDLIVQIADARNPVLFYSADLVDYVKEVNERKHCIMLVNKTDLLSDEQVQKWREYFIENDIDAVFWSAKANAELEHQISADQKAKDNASESSDAEADSSSEAENEPSSEEVTEDLAALEVKEGSIDNIDTPIPYVHTTSELIDYLKKKAAECNPDSDHVVVGMVGYPNVGKSSTINCIFGKKKTSVSATPGKTKHFQTLVIDEELTLCDCPGLVMPSFGFSASEMILNCILPVEKMRDYFSPTQVLCNRVPRKYFEALYSIMLPSPGDHEDPNRPPTAHELLTTVAFMKGFMSSKGIPDCSRAARIILKDVVNGKLRWIAAPPGVDQKLFDQYTFSTLPESKQGIHSEIILNELKKRNLLLNQNSSKVDTTFFDGNASAVHSTSIRGGPAVQVDASGKICLKKGKKDKLRRVYAHLDA